jgi:hypothetical protein
MRLPKARRTDLSGRAGRFDGVIYRQHTSAAAKLAAAAAHPLDPVTVRTGTPSPGTIATVPGVYVDESLPRGDEQLDATPPHPRHTPRRTRSQITRRELFIRSARTGDRLRKGRRALARLGQRHSLALRAPGYRTPEAPERSSRVSGLTRKCARKAASRCYSESHPSHTCGAAPRRSE